jgi:hypothetical protein
MAYAPWPQSASKLYLHSDRRLSAKLVPTFADSGRRVVSATDPYGRSSSIVFMRLCVPRFRSTISQKSGTAGKRPRTSGSVARNCDHLTTEAVYILLHNIYKFSSYLTGSKIHLRCVARNSGHQTAEAVFLMVYRSKK